MKIITSQIDRQNGGQAAGFGASITIIRRGRFSQSLPTSPAVSNP
jgi:hypothetical protein